MGHNCAQAITIWGQKRMGRGYVQVTVSLRSDQPHAFCAGETQAFEFDLPRLHRLTGVRAELIDDSDDVRTAAACTWHVETVLVKENNPGIYACPFTVMALHSYGPT